MESNLFSQFKLDKFDRQKIVEVEMLTDYTRNSHEDVIIKNIATDFNLQILKVNDNKLKKNVILAYKILLYKYTRQENMVFGVGYGDRCASKVRIVSSNFTDETAVKEIISENEQDLENIKSNKIYFINYNKCNEIIQIDFIFQVEIIGKIIRIDSLYNSKVYIENTMLRLAEHFINIMIQLDTNRYLKVRDIEIISKMEKEQVVFEFNKTKTEFPNKTIHQVFEDTVKAEKQKIALIYNQREMSYTELNQRSNKLASRLIDSGISKEEIVGIMMERSLEMIIAMIAILKAGGAYMPIDSGYPTDRKNYMLSDSKVKVLLTKTGMQQVDGYFGEIISVDSNEALTVEYQNLENEISPRELCNIVYTSGSTGKPKGVMIEHKSVVRLVKNTNHIKFNDSDRILQAASPVFDAVTFEVWSALLNGVTLCIINKEDSLSSKKLGDNIKNNKITVLWLTSALFNQITEQDANIYYPLRYLLVGGDVLSVKHINKVKLLHPNLIMVNGYGPTENTTFSTCHIIHKLYEKNIPIGKPISNTKAYILDGGNNPEPIGVPGELCFGGSGVARGYLNCEELTKKKFVINPFDKEDVIYHTGDLARWLGDGTIEFLGRIDSQVKIRGYRIELGEIENQLLRHAEIKEAAVIVKDDADKNKLLCAYVTSNREFTVNEIRAYLANELPTYMLPTYFVQLKEIPLNTSGKVDKRALLHENSNMKTGAEYIKPRNPMEEKMVDIWKEVLGAHRIGIQDKFFDLGGDSLMATMICVLAGENNINIELSDIFAKENIQNILDRSENQEEQSDQFTLVQSRYNLKDYKNIIKTKGENSVSQYEEDTLCSRKELKVVVQREITTYLHRSLPLCALMAYENYKAWYYCNYIQVFSYEDESGFIEINYLEPRDSYTDIADVICLGYHLLKTESNIVSFIKEKINLGYYLIINLDEYQLHNKKDYLKNHFVHPSIIYGYNDDASKVKAIGFDKARLFNELEFDYDEINKSYESSKIHYINYAPWCAWSAIQLIKPKSPDNLFPFSIKKFMRDLGSYINSTSDTYRLYSFEYSENKVKYGLDVYDVLIDNMRKMLYCEFTIDYRALHLLSEHKKCLYERIAYIIEMYKLGDEVKKSNALFLELVKIFNEIRLEYLGQAFVNFNINNLTKEQRHMIETVTIEIEELKEKEFVVLGNIYKMLEQHFLGKIV